MQGTWWWWWWWWLGRPAGLYYAADVFFSDFLFFSPPNLSRPLADRHQTLHRPYVRWWPGFTNVNKEFGSPSCEIFGAPKTSKIRRDRTTSQLDRECLWTSTRCQSMGNQRCKLGSLPIVLLINLANFVLQTEKNRTVVLTHPKSLFFGR